MDRFVIGTFILFSKIDIAFLFFKGEFEVVESAQEFRSKHFNLIVKRKKYAVYEILKLGYNVLFSDTDVVITRGKL